MSNGKNEHGYQKSQFDNKEAVIINDHPHQGANAICLGFHTTKKERGWAFKNKNTHELFFCF